MKELIQKLLGLFGLRLTRAQNRRKYLPRPGIDNIEVVARLCLNGGMPLTLIQVGACDGITSDSIYPFIKGGHIRAYLIEPSSHNFAKLRSFYGGVTNATLIHAAVAETDGERSLYSVRDEGRWRDSGWARQLASFYKEHLLRHGILENEIAEEKVKCLTLASLVRKYEIGQLDVLMIDTEGYDGEIVKMALQQGILPNFIVFENAQIVQHYPQDQLDDLYKRLESSGYGWTHDRINTMAVRLDFLRKPVVARQDLP